MKQITALAVTAAFLLTGCDTPVNDTLVSQAPAPAQNFAEARKAAAVCARHAPNWGSAETSLKAAGFAETKDRRLKAVARAQNAVILENPAADAVVLIGSRGSEGACIVGLRGMTPQQSYKLAEPWARKFGARTNAERGQGLAQNAEQAWGTIEENRIVYIAAYKTWDVLAAPGAAARLLYIKR